VLIAVSFKRSKLFGTVNLIVFILYTFPLYYGLYYELVKKALEVWRDMLIFLSALHIIIVGICLMVWKIKRMR
jgi:hypothetical protein